MNIFDTLMSLVSGIGTSKDKFTSLTHVYRPIDRTEIENAYRGDWVVRKAIDIPPYDEIKNGRDWQATSEQIESIEEEEKRLQIRRKIFRARVLSRLHGGSALFLGTGDADLTKPLMIDRIGKGGLAYVHVLTRYEITATDTNRDVTSPGFGEPEFWQMAGGNGSQLIIHPSRVIKFVGNPVPDPQLAAEPWWGDSILDSVDDAIKQVGLTFQGVASMVNEAKLDVIKVPGMMKGIVDKNYTEILTKRFTLANQLKSMVNALVIDSLEDFQTKQLSFTNLPEIMDRYLQAVSGAVDIPTTRFLGQSPQGMNSTGDGDYRNYLDRISAGQTLDLQPALKNLDECLIRSATGGRDPAIYYEWAPLWHLSEKEQTDIAKTRADTAKIYRDMDVIPGDAFAKAVVNRLVEDGTFPGLESALEESPIKVGEDQLDQPDEMGAAARTVPEEGDGGPGSEDDVATRRAIRRLPPANRAEASRRVAANDSRPMTLYIYRKVMNIGDFSKWAQEQDIPDLLDDLHVTIAYSKQPVDWMKVPGIWTDDEIEIVGGPRIVEEFGREGDTVKVLLIKSRKIEWRHEEVMDNTGASWDWPEFQPHISFSKADDRPVSDIKPYQGKIILGPEVWEEVKED